jgi:hypothetical protein
VYSDEIEGILGLGFEVGGRMVSGGGVIAKVRQGDLEESDEEDEAEEQELMNGVNGAKRLEEGVSDEGSGEDEESSQKEERVMRRKKTKKGNGRRVGIRRRLWHLRSWIEGCKYSEPWLLNNVDWRCRL